MPVPAPHTAEGDLPSVQREKQKILSMTKGALFRRTPEDRLELMLGLFGWGATVYTLTFNDAQLPHSFRGSARFGGTSWALCAGGGRILLIMSTR